MSKPKGQLDSLSDAKHEKLCGWLLAGMHYEKAVVLCATELGIVTNSRQLSEFWSTYCEERYLAKRRGATRLANSVVKEARSNPAGFNEATVDLLSRVAFNLADRAASAKDAPDKQTIQDVKTLTTLLVKADSEKTKKETLAFEKEKFKATLMSQLEKGLAALHAEIKDNPKALEAFNALKAALETGRAKK